MSEKYKFFEGGLFFVPLTVVGWIDVFTRKDYAEIIIKNLNYCIDNKGLIVYEFCIMLSHIHLICESKQGNLGSILRDFKSFTAKRIIEQIQENPQESRKEWLQYMFTFFAKRNSHNAQNQFWQQHNHPLVWNLLNGYKRKQNTFGITP